MKTTIKILGLMVFFMSFSLTAQDRTTVTATNTDISDNLDLRAVASIFGESKDLEDFERRLNNPKTQISNLDLNNDGYVDYLRVIEVVEANTHLIIVQAVLGNDLFQDVATVEVEKGANNTVQVQVVGDVFLYGRNYIYEPVYVHRPVIFSTFWVGFYQPYISPWHWNYYPNYYYAWHPFPIFRYRSHVGLYINFNNHYHCVSHRRSHRAMALHHNRRANGWERQYPGRSFNSRNQGIANRYELTQRNQGSRATAANQGSRATAATRANNTASTRTALSANTGRTAITRNQVSTNNTRAQQSVGTRNNATVNANRSVTNTRVQNASATRNNATATRSNTVSNHTRSTISNSNQQSRNQAVSSTRSNNTSSSRSQATPARSSSSSNSGLISQNRTSSRSQPAMSSGRSNSSSPSRSAATNSRRN